MSNGVPLCTWALEPATTSAEWEAASPATDRTSVIGQAGNAMHMQSVGIMMLYVLLLKQADKYTQALGHDVASNVADPSAGCIIILIVLCSV